MKENEEQSVCYPQPHSTKARIDIAADFTERFPEAQAPPPGP